MNAIEPIRFRNEYVSVSRLKTFEQCPLRFFFRYVGKVEEGESDKLAADLGIVVHGTLEYLYRWVQEEELTGLIPEEKLIELYDARFQASTLVGVEVYRDGLTQCQRYLDRNPDVDHWDILAVEQEFTIVIDGVKVRGYMDRVDRTGERSIEIVDYKTNRMLYEEEELETDLQVSVYAIAAPIIWPWVKEVTFRFEMLRHDTVQRPRRTTEDLDCAARYVAALARRTEEDGRKWLAKIGPLCAWCGYRDRCQPYKDALAERPEIVSVDDTDLLALSQERERISAIAKVADMRRKDLDKLLKAKIEICADDKGRLQIGEYTYKVISISRSSYDRSVAETIAKHTEEDPLAVERRITTVKKTAVDEELKKIRATMTGEGSRAKKAMLSMDVAAVTTKEPWFTKLDSSLNKNALRGEAGHNELPPAVQAEQERVQAERDVACDFCGAKPAKLVERGGERFAVCEEHKRKRKAPTT